MSLPLASAHFPVTGSFLGETENHAWFLNERGLVHADYKKNRLTQHSLLDMGAANELRGVVYGAQVLVSGELGIKVFHAITGKAVAKWNWPEDLSAYLKMRLPSVGRDGLAGSTDFVWQGVIRKPGPEQVGYLYPVLDSVRGSEYLTVFDQSILVALGGENTKKPNELGK